MPPSSQAPTQTPTSQPGGAGGMPPPGMAGMPPHGMGMPPPGMGPPPYGFPPGFPPPGMMPPGWNPGMMGGPGMMPPPGMQQGSAAGGTDDSSQPVSMPPQVRFWKIYSYGIWERI